MAGSATPARVRVAVPRLGAHPSDYVVRDFVRALVRAGAEPVRLGRRVGPTLARTRLPVPRLSKTPIIVPLMGPRPDVLAAAAMRGDPIPFCWDVWEPAWSTWVDLLERLRPPLVVTTALQSARYLDSALEASTVRHLPEAVNLAKYHAGAPLAERKVDVLELGRRHPGWHEAVKDQTTSQGFSHLYEKTRGAVIFEDEESLLAGLAQSKVSVCFPSSETDPERSGSVSTLTSRYLESMASRCLVLGQAPQELIDLLGFDPVVEADMTHPWPQLRELLASVGTYQARVDESYERVRSVGGWDTRARQLLDLIQDTNIAPAHRTA